MLRLDIYTCSFLWQFLSTLFVCMAVVFWKTLLLHHEVNITSCMFHTEQHALYGVHTALSGTCQLIFTVPTVKFTLVQISWCEHITHECTLASVFHAECWPWKHLLNTVKAAYAHAIYKSTFSMVCRFNTSFVANPWQYKYGICTNNDNNANNMENENNLLSWQPINASPIDVNTFMLAVKTLKCRAEVTDWN